MADNDNDNEGAHRCEAVAASTGQRCRAVALAGSKYCWFHSPEIAAERADAQHRGAIAKPRRYLVLGETNLKTPEDVKKLLAVMMAEVVEAEPTDDTRVQAKARTLAALAREMLKACDAAATEKLTQAMAELVKKVKSIEAKIQRGEHGRSAAK